MNQIEKIKKELSPSKDYIFGKLLVKGKKIHYIYNEVLTNTENINKLVLQSLLKIKSPKNLENKLPNKTKIIKEEEIVNHLNNGYLILIQDKIYALEEKASLDRGITKIESELSLNGPKDSFNETYNNNLGLIRKRIKSKDLKVKELEIGKYTKNKTGILYIGTIVKKDLVNHVLKNLEKINIDGIIDSSYLKESLENHFNVFPTIIATERPDKATMALLEGKVVILVDNSPYALILPSLLMDFFHTTDDYYQKPINTTIIRIIRLIAFLIAIFTPAIYISITTRNYNLVPTSLLIMLKAGRTNVPFPAYIEALFMIVCFEILKESDIRMSTTTGSSISILGGLILGDAAVAAGIVSPIMIIVIAISSIAGLIFSSVELGNALRFYKILLLFLGTLFGIYGILIGAIILMRNIQTTEIFGYSYLAIDQNEIKDSILKISSKIKKRNSSLTNNIIRGRYK